MNYLSVANLGGASITSLYLWAQVVFLLFLSGAIYLASSGKRTAAWVVAAVGFGCIHGYKTMSSRIDDYLMSDRSITGYRLEREEGSFASTESTRSYIVLSKEKECEKTFYYKEQLPNGLFVLKPKTGQTTCLDRMVKINCSKLSINTCVDKIKGNIARLSIPDVFEATFN